MKWGKSVSDGMFLDLLPNCPYRPVDWRWQQASLIQQNGLRFRKHRDDSWVRATVHLLDRIQYAKRLRRNDLLDSLDHARRIRFSAAHDLRIEVEARLLSNQSLEDIGSRCGLPVAAIEGYERVFYNIREKLEATDYISFLIDPTVSPLTGLPAREVIIRSLAYGGGPLVVDSLYEFLARQKSGSTHREPVATAVLRHDRYFHLALARESLQSGQVCRLLKLITALDRLDEARDTRALSKALVFDLDLADELLVQSVGSSRVWSGPDREESHNASSDSSCEEMMSDVLVMENMIRSWAAAG